MKKINKDYKLKIIFITISLILLFTNVLYPSQFSRENLRLETGAGDDTYPRMKRADVLPFNNYNKFRRWLTDFRKTQLVAEETIDVKKIEKMFKEVYGKKIPASDYIYYYLKVLDILKDYPFAAYQIVNWNIEELSELSRIFDYFAKGVALDPSYKEKRGKKYSLEKWLVKSDIDSFGTPDIFISHLKKKIKTTMKSVKLAMGVYEVATINSARGLMKALGLNKDDVIILYDKKITPREVRLEPAQIENLLPGYDIRLSSEFSDKEAVRIGFYDRGTTVEYSEDSLVVWLCNIPFKYNLLKRSSETELANIRKALSIPPTRKVIVVGSPDPQEFIEVMEAYYALYGRLGYAERPLVIAGFRYEPTEDTLKLLNERHSIVIRDDMNKPFPNVQNNDVLILNTSGELLGMYALGVAVVGKNRNMVEPASQGSAILFFEGGSYDIESVKALVEAGAAQVFSKENLRALMSSETEAEQRGKKALEVATGYGTKTLVSAENLALQIIGAKSLLRKQYCSWGRSNQKQLKILIKKFRRILSEIPALFKCL